MKRGLGVKCLEPTKDRDKGWAREQGGAKIEGRGRNKGRGETIPKKTKAKFMRLILHKLIKGAFQISMIRLSQWEILCFIME